MKTPSLNIVFLFALYATAVPAEIEDHQFIGSFPEQIERRWVGPEFWANRLQDWRIADGWLECINGSKNKPMRTVHLLTHRLANANLDFETSVVTDPIGQVNTNSAAGFLLGVGKKLDYRAAALAHHSFGEDSGVFAGIDGSGKLFIRQTKPDGTIHAQSDKAVSLNSEVNLAIRFASRNGTSQLYLNVLDIESGTILDSISTNQVASETLTGNVALVSHPGDGGRFRFQDWEMSGPKLEFGQDRLCGPVLSTQYTLSNHILKLTAQMMPVGKADHQTADLQIQTGDGTWNTVDTAKIIVPGYTVPFRVEDWDSGIDAPYRVVYRLTQDGGNEKNYYYHGTIRHDPVEKEEIVIAGFTGTSHNRLGVERGDFNWTPGFIWFPHTEVAGHVAKQKPDVLFFSGDQIYEGGSPTGVDRQNIFDDYLYKWYLWCWSFRDLTKDIPCVTIPDDHDVYQPNLWGESGRKTDKDDKGGYTETPEFVNMVERTQTSHLPDPFDPTPVEQGIGVYYTSMNYGRISFAVIEDRKFKTGCRDRTPPTTSGRPDHVIDPAFDPKTADVAGAQLLGERQEKFLQYWATDWRGVDMKIALSQTVFANAASHHGGDLTYLVADYDSNGWPQSGRYRALHELRRGFAFMLGGDQHLSLIIHHGIDDWNDAGWSFTVPSVANYYPRAWWPQKEAHRRFDGLPDYAGEFLDGLGNHVSVYAATNPDKKTGVFPEFLHDRMPGYGIVRMNKDDRTITMECWSRYADPDNPNAKQYDGWPRTVDQLDNYGRKATAYLPAITVNGMENPVIQVIDETNDEIVYTLRINGTEFRPKVFAEGTYTIRLGELNTVHERILQGIESIPEGTHQEIRIQL